MRLLACAARTLSLAALLASTTVSAQAAFRAPESIRVGLSVMSQVVENSGRLIEAKRYDQLPAQSNEFEAGLTALEQGLGDPPSQFKMRIEPLLARARVAAGALSEAATSHRDSMLPIAHDQLAEAVTAIAALFPESLRPAASAAKRPSAD